jgi:hypothetical protein
VYNNVAQIDQDPVGIWQAFNFRAAPDGFLDGPAKMIGQSADMAGGSAGGDNHHIGKGGFSGQVNDGQVFRLVILERLDQQPGQRADIFDRCRTG